MFTVSISELETAWRPISETEGERLENLLERACATLRLRVPTLNERTDTDPDLRTVAVGIVVDMVKRAAAATTDGPAVTSTSETAGQFSRQESYANPTGNLYVLDNELALLYPKRARAARTIKTPPSRW